MKNLMRMAAFRCLNSDDNVSGGAPATSSDGDFDVHSLASDAYRATAGEGEVPAEEDEDDLDNAAGKKATEGEKDDEDEDGKKKSAADDDDKKPDDSKKSENADPLELDTEFAKANPELAKTYGDQLALLRQNIDAVTPMLALEKQLTDASTAPAALKSFAEAIATHHGLDLAEILGITPAPTEKTPDAPDWRALGFDSKDEFDQAPDWQKAGYESPTEFKLAKEIEALKALINPTIESQKKAAEDAKQAQAKSRFEAAIKEAAPAAIASLKAEHGWQVTDGQALEAALKFPQLASTDLKAAILAAFPVELAKHYAASSAKKTGSKMPEMPQGGSRNGVTVPDPDKASPQELAEYAYSQL